MKKKIFLIMLILIIILLTYKLINYIDHKSSLSGLNEYMFTENEITIKTFKYNGKNYVISRYYDNSSSWSHLNLLLKDNNSYYVLENITKCDTLDNGGNLYLKDNELYIHCIGTNGFIHKYLINDLYIEKEIINFDFTNTPNISQLHIGIDKIDNNYIYLSSPFKVDNRDKNEPKVKCSFKNKECGYIQ